MGQTLHTDRGYVKEWAPGPLGWKDRGRCPRPVLLTEQVPFRNATPHESRSKVSPVQLCRRNANAHTKAARKLSRAASGMDCRRVPVPFITGHSAERAQRVHDAIATP